MVHPQHLCHGVVLYGRDHHVLASHVTLDVRLVEFDKSSGEEGVCRIGLAVSVRHVLGVDASREIAFRGRNLHVLVFRVVAFNDLNLHQGLVADDGGNGNHRELGVASGRGADGLGNGDDAGLAARRGDLIGNKAG